MILIFQQTMSEITRKYSEILAIAKLEPGLKHIFVEGLSDYYFINDFLTYHKISGIAVYEINMVDFSDEYVKMKDEEVVLYRNNNKERVILLAHLLESDLKGANISILCVVDVDWDAVVGNLRKGQYLSYTDYNSMDMYLFDNYVVEKYLQQGFHIKTVHIVPLMDSLAVVGRQVFHVHGLLQEKNKTMVSNDKDFHFDKVTYTCSLDFDSYWNKTIQKSGLSSVDTMLRAKYDVRISNSCDPRSEIQGHDFVHYLFFCVKKIKPKLSMNEDVFANVFWQYANLDAMKQELLFQKIMAL